MKIKLLILVVLSVWLMGWFWALPDGKLRVSFLQVGQGDSILIQTPRGKRVLIDGGPDARVSSRLSKVLSFFVKDLDMLILTHGDSDHLAGLIEAERRYRVGAIVLPTAYSGTMVAEQFMNEIQDVPIFLGGEGRDFEIEPGVFLDFIYSGNEAMFVDGQNTNEDSLVFRLRYGERTVLFTGDIGTREEDLILAQGSEIGAEILKVPHHGSKGSSSLEFLRAVDPKFAVCSVGATNAFGHPEAETLERYAELGVEFLRTDRQGIITFVTDGSDWEYNTER